MSDPDRADPMLHAAVRYVAGCGVALAVVALAAFDVRTAAGVLAGGLLATANLAVFVRVGEAFLTRRGNTAPWGVVAVMKLLLLFGAVWLLLRNGAVPGLALAAGYASLPLGITICSLFGPRPPDDDPRDDGGARPQTPADPGKPG
jgi:hypothetical protein